MKSRLCKPAVIIVMVMFVLLLGCKLKAPVAKDYTFSAFRGLNTGEMDKSEMDKSEMDKSIHQQCRPHKHVYFLKIHKAASTTAYSIFARFGLLHGLNVITLLKRCNSIYWRQFDEFLPQPRHLQNGKYDMYIEHSIYDEVYLGSKLQEDTVNIAILREPMSHFRSVFLHYDLARRLGLRGDFKAALSEFLRRPSHYAPRHERGVEVTQNRVAMEFGFEGNGTSVEDYLQYLDARFLVLIVERLSESLVVMRRQLCWGMKDILHAHHRKQDYEAPEASDKLTALHQAWSPLDYVFYEFFSKRMGERIRKQDKDFQQEVALFETYLQQTNEFCHDICVRMGLLRVSGASETDRLAALAEIRYFAESRWDDGFNITGLDCLLMRYHPSIFRDAQKVRLFPEYCHGEKDSTGQLRFNPKYCDRSLQYGLPRFLTTNNYFVSPCF